MKIAFVGQMNYYDCCIPQNMKGVEIVKLDINWDASDLYQHECLLNEEYKDVDVWFFFRGEFVPERYFEKLNGITVNISTEPIEREDTSYYLKQCKEKFDKFYHYDKTQISLVEQLGVHVDGDFQLPVDLDTYEPLLLEKQYDLSFVGRSTEHREHIFSSLKHKRNFLHVAHGLNGSGLVEVYDKSKINLNVKIGEYSQLPHRMQNIIACGGFVLSERLSHNDDLKEYEHYIPFSSIHELEDKVEHYLENEKERNKISKKGLEYVKERFDSRKCWKNLIEEVMK